MTEITEECWIWPGKLFDSGYGIFQVNAKSRKAHRVLYEAAIGKVPEGLVLDHLCRNRACVNPKHLEPVTFKDNILRGEGWAAKNARKTHCVRGHELSGENIRDRPNARICILCERIRNREVQRRKRARLREERHAND